MAFFTAGFGLLLHFLFWGVGLALLVTPRHWRSGWPALCAPAALALQSAVVWFGAHSSLEGTREYGLASAVIPVLLLAAGLWRAIAVQKRSLWRELSAWQGVGFLMAVTLNGLLIPFSASSKTLTSSSLGSCDAADYAAGARVLLEFAHSDRTGFLGLTEVVHLHSVDNFFDHWLRLNHFTPSALVALNASICDAQPYELISVMTAVFVALSLPTVYWLARYTFGYRAWVSAWVTAIYGLSPLLWYAVYHVAMSQILAAMAIALLTGAALALWQEGAAWRRGLAWSGVLAVAYWLIMGAYNFIVIVSLVPAVAYAGGVTLRTRSWRKFGRWLVLLVAPLAVVGVIFTERTLGLVERFLLFQQYDFGWKIPALTPEGWIGLLGSVSLAPLPAPLRWSFGGLLLLLIAIAVGLTWKRRSATVWLVFAATLPILTGYAFLEFRGAARGTNASYDAYKLFCVFYPGLLAGFGYWLTLARNGNRPLRWIALVFAVATLGFNGYAARLFMKRMESPPLLVDRSLVQLQRLEDSPDVTSLNMLIGDFWSRLWANSFLLKKPQYFQTYTYEGRRNTELKGEWDLLGGIIQIRTPGQREELRLAPPYSLLDTRDRHYVRVKFGDGWYEPELLARAGSRWRWTKGDASLLLENPHPHPLAVSLRASMRSLTDRDLQIWAEGKIIRSFNVGAQQRFLRAPVIVIPPGTSTIEFKSSAPPTSPGPADDRKLGFAAYSIEIDVRAASDVER